MHNTCEQPMSTLSPIYTTSQKNEHSIHNIVSDTPENIDKRPTTFYVNCIEQTIAAGLHLLIMASFEIYFYFYVIIDIERQLFLNKVDDYTNSVTLLYAQYLTPTNIAIIKIVVPEKQIKDFVSRLFENYMSALQTQKQLYESLLKKSILVVILIAGGLWSVTMIGIINYKKHIKWKWILFENAIMFITLGAFEYFFYTQIILKYTPITDAELKYRFVNKITQPILANDSLY